MEQGNLAGAHIVYGAAAVIGGILFLWFCWPAVFKGILNTGNVCGMLFSAAAVFGAVRHRQLHRLLMELWQKKPGRIFLIVFFLSAAAAVVLMAAATAAILRASSAAIPADTPAVVLGCSVKGSKPSRILEERIDAAYAYMKEHPGSICILSGGRGKDEDISEAECMYRELEAAGVDTGRLYKEDTSVNTQENLENAGEILNRLGETGAITIISSEFHLYRGRRWAETLGFEHYGYAAHTDFRYLPTYFLREIIAVVKLWLIG